MGQKSTPTGSGSNLMKLILEIFYPKKCVGCKKLGFYFCKECIGNIEQESLVCPFCERPAIGGATHPVCERKYGLDGLWSLGVYKGPLKSSIQKLKYKWVKELGEILVDLTIDYWARHEPYILERIKKDYGKNWTVVPVPLHWTRKNFRGFNQASLIGQLFAQKTGLTYREFLKRTKMTKSQVGLKSNQRRENIRGAFTIASSLQSLASNVLLIDDVWTTGSTLKECCYVLKRGGAKKVWALTLAR